MDKPEATSHVGGQNIAVERVQIGARMEKRMVKVLKALAEYLDISLGDLLEGIVLHAFEGKKHPFSDLTLQKITQLKEVYGVDYDASASHQLSEGSAPTPNKEILK